MTRSPNLDSSTSTYDVMRPKASKYLGLLEVLYHPPFVLVLLVTVFEVMLVLIVLGRPCYSHRLPKATNSRNNFIKVVDIKKKKYVSDIFLALYSRQHAAANNINDAGF